ncbi:nitrite reductase small subunit NirD [Thermobifida halotolerans]|uniref:Nitrite reductase small subunit NirD n=1 Tax=Thermobifida halotolerans TaxID=483545 RepID=A0AA97M5C1_9ACTN|nr:nitrite reductase small subunit NirD [Thermobifida halotolerans]UOE20981.1 nitrite reductase small subunit NirD [Thermobifida halotolerans]
MTTTTLTHERSWVGVCPSGSLIPERGVAVLLPDGAQAALFRTFDGCLYAVGNVDPFSGAAVMSRGIVGDRGGEPTVASPMLKQVFSLRSGVCLDVEGVGLPVYAVRERGGRVEIAAEST